MSRFEKTQDMRKEKKMSRFDYVKYDGIAIETQRQFKFGFEEISNAVSD